MDINNLNLNSIENDLFEKEKRCEKKINIYIKQRTSIVPFLAILDGRQSLLLSEFSRPAYIGVFGFILLIWVCHLQLL